MAPLPRECALLGLLGIASLGYIAPAFTRSLWNPDEPRVAHIGQAMARPAGDLVVPRVNGQPFLQEPPLVHWLNALSFRAFGGGLGRDWVPRLSSMAFALGTLLLVGHRCRRLFGARAGFLAALVLATLAEYLEVANRAGTDAALTFFVAVGGFEILEIARERRLAPRRALVLGAAAGLAFLTKNLLGPVFLGLILGAALVRRRDLLRGREAWLGWLALASASALVAGPWLLALGLRDPSLGLLREVLWENTAGRFTSEAKHDPGLLEFLARVLGNWLPWTPLLLVALWDLGRRALRRGSAAEGWVLLAWIALPTLLVLLSGSKRNLYLLPVYPALASALAVRLADWVDRPAARAIGVPLVVLAVVGGALLAALGGVWAGPLPFSVFAGLAALLYLVYRWLRSGGMRSRPATAAAAVLAAGLLMAMGNLARYRMVEGARSYAPLGAELRAFRGRGLEVGGYRLGLREVSAVAYYLEEEIPNLSDPAGAEAWLSPAAPPAVLVVERRILDGDAPGALRRAPGRLDWEVSRGLVVLANRTLPLEPESGPAPGK